MLIQVTMHHHIMWSLLGVLLWASLLRPSCVNAAFVETFEPNPFKNTTNYLPGLWMQIGRFVEDGKALVGEAKGFSLFLDEPNPWAETVMLQWDGSTPAQLVFELVRYHVPASCALKVLNTTDGEQWSEFFSQHIGDLPFQVWKTIRLTMPLDKLKAGTKFALRFQYIHACHYSSCCPGITINNLVLPAKAPAAAAAVLKARLGSAVTDAATDSLNDVPPESPAHEESPSTAQDSDAAGTSPTSTLHGKASPHVKQPNPGNDPADHSPPRAPDSDIRADGAADEPAKITLNSATSIGESNVLDKDGPAANKSSTDAKPSTLVPLSSNGVLHPSKPHGNTGDVADDDSSPPAEALNDAAPSTNNAALKVDETVHPANPTVSTPSATSVASTAVLTNAATPPQATVANDVAAQAGIDPSANPGANDAAAQNSQNSGAGPLQANSNPAVADWQKAAHQTVAKLCTNEAFTSLAKSPRSCKLWGDVEAVDFEIQPTSMFTSGPLTQFPMPLDSDLPQSVSSRGGTSRGLALVSPACSGRAVARTVFKSIQQPAKSSRAAGIRLQPFTSADLINASPVVRCFLTLDDTKGQTETQRALASKEDRCYTCSESEGCPSVQGAWFSDAFTFDVPGCKPDGSLPHPVYVQMVLSPGWKALVAKFEVCRDFGTGCFDPDYEAKKLKDAKKCTASAC